MIAAAATIVLLPNAPLGVMTTAVQALARVLLPSAAVFLLLLCNDKEVLGPWVNKAWLNVVATVIVALLIELSLVLVISTEIPSINVAQLFAILTIALVISLIGGGAILVAGRRGRIPEVEVEPVDKANWRMPPLAFLARPVWSRGRAVGMYALRGYLVLAVMLLAVKAARLATGH